MKLQELLIFSGEDCFEQGTRRNAGQRLWVRLALAWNPMYWADTNAKGEDHVVLYSAAESNSAPVRTAALSGRDTHTPVGVIP